MYWKPVFNVLAPDFEVWIVNARDLQQVPGRKTDVKDAEWIAQLMRHGLLKRSFIPDVEQRAICRDLTRYRTRLVGERSSASNRLQKILEDANIKLSSVATDIQGVSARLMIKALIAGETDGAELANLAKGRLRQKLPELEAALVGRVRPHHCFMLHEVLYHLDELNECLEVLNARIRECTAPYKDIIQRLDAIPGINRYTAEVILAEIGPMSRPFRPPSTWLPGPVCARATTSAPTSVAAARPDAGRIGYGPPWSKPLGLLLAPKTPISAHSSINCAPAAATNALRWLWHIPS